MAVIVNREKDIVLDALSTWWFLSKKAARYSGWTITPTRRSDRVKLHNTNLLGEWIEDVLNTATSIKMLPITEITIGRAFRTLFRTTIGSELIFPKKVSFNWVSHSCSSHLSSLEFVTQSSCLTALKWSCLERQQALLTYKQYFHLPSVIRLGPRQKWIQIGGQKRIFCECWEYPLYIIMGIGPSITISVIIYSV